LGTSDQSEFDGCPNQERGQNAGSEDFDGGLPSCTARITPSLQERTKLPDVSGCMAIFEAKVGQNALRSALGGSVKQFVKVVLSQEKHIFRKGGFFRINHG
jgi:hypothetical protein